MQLYETTAECVWVWVLKMCAALNSPSTLNSHASCNVFSWSVYKPYCALAPLHRSMRPCSRKLMVDCICLCARLPLPLLRHCNLSACVCVCGLFLKYLNDVVTKSRTLRFLVFLFHYMAVGAACSCIYCAETFSIIYLMLCPSPLPPRRPVSTWILDWIAGGIKKEANTRLYHSRLSSANNSVHHFMATETNRKRRVDFIGKTLAKRNKIRRYPVTCTCNT